MDVILTGVALTENADGLLKLVFKGDLEAKHDTTRSGKPMVIEDVMVFTSLNDQATYPLKGHKYEGKTLMEANAMRFFDELVATDHVDKKEDAEALIAGLPDASEAFDEELVKDMHVQFICHQDPDTGDRTAEFIRFPATEGDYRREMNAVSKESRKKIRFGK